MTPDERKSLFLRGLTPPAAVPIDVDALEELVDDDSFADSLAGAGFVRTLRSRFPHSPLWQDHDAAQILQAVELNTEGGPQESPEWNDYFMGVYVAGDDNGLRELIRRAKHRDGTTAALVTGTDAMGLLEAAAAESEAFASVAAANGFQTGKVELGDFPPGSMTAFGAIGATVPASSNTGIPSATAATRNVEQTATSTPAPVGRPGGPPMPTSPVRPPVAAPAAAPAAAAGPAALPVSAGPPMRLGAATMATPDMTAGLVRLGDPSRPAARLAISEAIALDESLTIAVRKLLLPAEGYTWIHDSSDPLRAASLVQLDTGAGAGTATPAASLPDFTGEGNGKLQGEVLQNAATARYGCRLFTFTGGTENFGDFVDINDGKFALAARVRELLTK